MRGLWLKIWIDSQPRSVAALDRVGEAAGGGNMRADQHASSDNSRLEICPLADRRAAHRRREDGTLQLARRPPRRRRAGAADRGHRPRALDRGERRADPRRAATGWSSTGTRGRSRRRRAPSATPRRWRGCSSPAPPTATRRPPRTSRPGRPSTAPAAATAATPADEPGGGGPPAGARRGGDRGRGPDPRPGRLPQRAATTTS